VIEVSVQPQRFTVGRESKLAIRFTNIGSAACSDIIFKLGLPSGFLLLRGRDRIEIPQLQAGEDYTYHAIVHPQVSGNFAIVSGNFSYRNSYGRPVRVSDFRAEILVLSESVDEATAPLCVEWTGQELAVDEYDVLRLVVRNTADFPLRNPILTIEGPIRIAPPGPRVQLITLRPGAESEVPFIVFPEQSGRNVPIHAHVAYIDNLGRRCGYDEFLSVVVIRQRDAAGNGLPDKETILYLAANPTDLPLIRSDKEMKEVRRQLQMGRHRDRFQIEYRTAVGFEDIGQALADCNPRIVHFSGHGGPGDSVYLEDAEGNCSPVQPEHLAGLLRLHAATVECVIVNACRTMRLAEAMGGHFEHVIAMRNDVGDEEAIRFSIGFYQGLAGGIPVPAAFERGRIFLLARPLARPDYDSPVLLVNGHVAV
jgi:hypothetical protein